MVPAMDALGPAARQREFSAAILRVAFSINVRRNRVCLAHALRESSAGFTPCAIRNCMTFWARRSGEICAIIGIERNVFLLRYARLDCQRELQRPSGRRRAK
jgi:hypothetical protein